MKRRIIHSALAFLLGAAASAVPALAQSTHVDRISQYDGSKTCLGCHPESAKEVAASLHYQQQAEPQYLKTWPKGQLAGMMLSY